MVGRNKVIKVASLLSIFYIFFLSIFTICSIDPINQCKDLIKENKISNNDLVLLLNTFYFSYNRSASLIDAQIDYHRHIKITESIGNYLYTTRRNPSKVVLEIPQTPMILDAAKTCAYSFEKYKNAAATYVHCIEHALKNNGFENKEITDLLITFRTNTKYTILNTIKIYYDTIQTLYCDLSNKNNKNKNIAADNTANNHVVKNIETGRDNITQKNFIHTIITALPFFAETMFISLDEKYIVVNQALHDFIFHNSSSYAHIWNTIEYQRATIYCNAYKELVHAAITKNPHILSHAKTFDTTGIVDPKHRENLPTPFELTITPINF